MAHDKSSDTSDTHNTLHVEVCQLSDTPGLCPFFLPCCERPASWGEAWGLPELMMTLWVSLSHSRFKLERSHDLVMSPILCP